MAGLYDVPRAIGAEEFCGRASSLHLGDLVLGRMESSVATYERSARRIRRDGLDHLVFGVSGSGEAAQLTALDLSQPVELPQTALDGYCIIAPRKLAFRFGDPSRLHGARVANPAAGLAAGFLAQLMSAAPHLPVSQSGYLARAVMELLASAIGDAPPASRVRPRPSRRARAREYIEAKLSDPDLGADAVARETGMSRSVLYSLFRSDGGVAKYIQSRRLSWASRLLVEDRELSITEVADLCCFSSESQFSRAFRAAFGEAPRDHRSRPRGTDAWLRAAELRDDGAFSRWVRDLATSG